MAKNSEEENEEQKAFKAYANLQLLVKKLDQFTLLFGNLEHFYQSTMSVYLGV